METQKILNLLKSSENEYLKFATKKWYVIDSETGTYSENEPIKFLTRSIESSLCVIIMMHIFWSQEIFLLEVIIQKRHFKIASPLENAEQINETFVDEGQHVNIAMSTYNLIEYSDNYSDTSGSLWHFNRDEQPKENNEELSDLSADNSSSFKHKSNLVGVLPNGGGKNGVKIAVPLKYLSNFWRSLEMPLINCKIELSLTWNQNWILSTVADNSAFAITDTKVYVPVVTLKTEDNTKLSKLLSEGFKRSVYWNECKVIPNEKYNANEYIRERLNASIERVKKLFVLAYDTENNGATENSHRKYFLPRMTINNYNIEIGGRNFYDQPINDLIKQYEEVRKISTGQGDDYTTGCLLDYVYFKDDFRLIAADLSKQKALDADPKAIQQIIFTGQVDDKDLTVFYVFEKSKETILQFFKGTTKVL